MSNSSLKLYLEINESKYIFLVGKNDEHDYFELIHKLEAPLEGIENNRISDLDKVFKTIKKNLYLIEEKFNFSFKEIILILDNFNPSFINLSGFKKLNGSQILRENITYILNTLKSCVDEIELKKDVLHIFNSKFYLDDKKIENLPIGLFGDFYSHELSFVLIDKNIHNNIKNIFDKCNLKIKKILIKSFVKGANISDNNNNVDTFFYIKIGEENSKIIYFENNSLKSEERFPFGTDIVMKDISKITSVKIETIKKILSKIKSHEEILQDELVEEIYFNNEPYIKVKKKLIYEIALARIEEILNILIIKNINIQHYNKHSKKIFLEIDDRVQLRALNDTYKNILLNNGGFNYNLIENLSDDSILSSVNKIVQYGWKKEAIPISASRKSMIARLFSKLFK